MSGSDIHKMKTKGILMDPVKAEAINKAVGKTVLKKVTKETETYPVLKETPLDNRIIVLEDKAADKSAGGIILPNESTTKPFTGRVLAAGPQCEAVKLHDQVRYGQRAGDKIEIDGVEYLALRETDCYTILNK